MERDKEAAGRYGNRADQVSNIAKDAGDKKVRTILTGVAEGYEQ